MGTHSFWRGARPRVLVAVLAAVLAGMASFTANVLPASALGNPVLITITVSPVAVSVPAGDTEQFSATGHYSDLSTKNLTDVVTWSTSSGSTATISNTPGSQGLATAVSTGLATVTGTDGSTFGTAALTVLPAVLIAVTVSPSVTSIPLGETVPFSATGHYSDGSTQNLTKSVMWTSSSSAVATVSNATGSQGDVTATGTGAATITAADSSTSISGISAVTVLPAALLTITVSPPAADIPAGETESFTATGLYSDGSKQNVTDSVTWSSSDTADVTVSNSTGSQGEVTAIVTGASTITATDPTTSIEGVALVTVLPAVLLAIDVSPVAPSVPAGETRQFTATGVYSDASTQNLTDSVTWSSSSTSVATISNVAGSQGLATATGTGPTTITAADPAASISGTAVLTVLPAVLLAITVSPLAANVPAGETKQFAATGLYSDGTTADLTDAVTWSSSDTSDATVSNSSGSQGVVTGVAEGASTITATDPTASIFGTAVVTVLPAVLVAITVTPVEASVALYGSQQFTATGHYSDLSTQDLTGSVTWSSSDTGEVSISNIVGSQGLATGLATGEVVLTATDPSSAIAGVASLDVTGPAITLSPSSGAAKTHLVVDGKGFTPGEKVAIHFRTGVSEAPHYLICTAVVGTDGTFSCKGRIRGAAKSGAPGIHSVTAKEYHVHGVIASTEFTLT